MRRGGRRHRMVKNTCKQERKTQLQQMAFVQSQVTRETKQKKEKKEIKQTNKSKIIISYSPIQKCAA